MKMKIKKNKRAVFFTFIAMFIVVLVVAVVSTRDSYRYREKSRAVTARIRTMNNFIDDFEKDLDREIYIGGYRSLLSMNAYIRQIEDYVEDFDAIFEEILVNGTANGTSMDLMSQDTKGASINSWLARLNDEAAEQNINVDITVNDVTVTQENPWAVIINFESTVVIDDIKSLASWNFDKVYTREISIIGFEDPLFTVGTYDEVISLINVTPISSLDFVTGGGDATNLNTHLLGDYYVNNPDAPSYLMRFEGNFSPSPYGIESLIDITALDAPDPDKSVVDHVYFDTTNPTVYCNVSGGVPSWFKIDIDHYDFYEIDNLTSVVCS